MISRIILNNIRFYAFHGVSGQEKVVGNNFIVSIGITAPLDRAIASDSVCDTIDYADLYSLVKKEMDTPSSLLEHIAGRILRSLKDSFPQITEAEITVSKLNPPLMGEVESATVVLRETFINQENTI
ncbi:MAG: dihydroneopterin aldolase [Tannerellaceae bacterium]|jgi:dihydroneopterin aldolase|nr:dihydroneopterin aldolase [Tannerellaceae bacterium]